MNYEQNKYKFSQFQLMDMSGKNQYKTTDHASMDYIMQYTPDKIVTKLNELVIGQNDAKRVLAIAAFNRLIRMRDYKENKYHTDLEKSNILMMGPSGCGKTYLVKSLAKVVDVPCAIVDATSITSSGYVGGDTKDILTALVKEATQFVIASGMTATSAKTQEAAELGIIYIDEIDKIRAIKDTTGRDVRGLAVQEELLKIIEGTTVDIKGCSSELDTSNILFICGGRFGGLSDIIKERVNGKNGSIGFGATHHTDPESVEDKEYRYLKQTHANDLVEFGMLRELVGRIPCHVSLHGLDAVNLSSILTEPKNSIIKQYKAFYRHLGINLKFTPQVINYFAEEAVKSGTGARALRSIVEYALRDIHFKLPSKGVKSFTVSKKNIRIP